MFVFSPPPDGEVTCGCHSPSGKLGTTQEVALILVAVVVLALIFIGIHNAWDVAVFLVTQHTVLGATDVTAAAPPVTPEPIAAPVTAQSDGSGSLSPG